MADEHRLSADIERADRARTLRDDPVFVEAVEQMKADIIRMWREAPTVEARERCHVAITTADMLPHLLGQYIGKGKEAAAKLAELIQSSQSGTTVDETGPET